MTKMATFFKDHITTYSDKANGLASVSREMQCEPVTPSLNAIIADAIAAHVKEYHSAKRGRFVPPTIDEIIAYQVECPELQNIDAKDFYEGYADAGWIDTQGKPVRNWKLKLRTRSKYQITRVNSNVKKVKLFPLPGGKTCSVKDCTMPAVYRKPGSTYYGFCCSEHLPPEVKEKYE